MKLDLVGGRKMNIALIGYGKMGQAIAKNSIKPHNIALIVDPEIDKTCAPVSNKDTLCLRSISEIPSELLSKIDVFVEFTSPASALENINRIIDTKNDARIICGTTGWDPKTILEKLNQKGAMLLYGSNFSIGVNIISKALATVTKDLKKLGNFNASMVEYHHKNKKDAPSGTAKMLAEIIEGQNTPCPISSVRSGYYPGTHSICFDSEFETIEIKHTARNRDLFCQGILASTTWLLKQKKPGLYNFENVINA